MLCRFSSMAASCVVGADLVVNTKNLLKYTRPGVIQSGTPNCSGAEPLQFLNVHGFDCIGKRLRALFPRPRFLVMTNDPVHVTATDSYYRGAAGLTFQRHEPKRFLNARVNEEVSGAIITRESNGVGTILNPRNVFGAPLQFSKLLALWPVADDQQVKFISVSPVQKLEGPKQRLGVLFPGQTADIKKQLLITGNAQLGACGFSVVLRHRLKNAGVHAEPDRAHIAHTPFRKDAGQKLGGHKRSLKAIVKLAHICARQLHGSMRSASAQEFRAAAQICFGEMRMVKANHRNFQGTADRNRFPSNLVWVTRFDDIRPFMFNNFFDGSQV